MTEKLPPSAREAERGSGQQAATELSDYAKKYGRYLNTPYSYLTPVQHNVPYLGNSPNDGLSTELRDRIEGYQRRKFHHFTTQELVDLDAISSRELKECTLRPGHWHRIFDCWEMGKPSNASWRKTEPFYPLNGPNGEMGVWTMEDPTVKELMRPILQIASWMLLSKHVLPWFTALVEGERKDISPSRVRPEDRPLKPDEEIQSIEIPGTARDVRYYTKVRDNLLNLMASQTRWEFKFGFAKYGEDPFKKGRKSYTLGVTNRGMTQGKWSICSYLTYEHVEALLMNNLTSADKMAVQYSTANTICHELMHALNMVAPLFMNKSTLAGLEPYCNDNAVAEIGFAWEIEVNGGIPTRFINYSAESRLPLGLWLLTKWPTINRPTCAPDRPILQSPGPYEQQIIYPIQVSALSDIQQEDFWDVGVRAFGCAIFQYRAFQQGVLVNYAPFTEGPEKPPLEGHSASVTKLLALNLSNNETRLDGTSYADAIEPIVEEIRKRIESSVGLEQSLKKALAFGESLVRRSKLDKEYWDTTQKQFTEVKNVGPLVVGYLNSLDAPNTDADKIQFVFESLSGFVRRVRNNHETLVAVSKTLAQEEHNGRQDPGRTDYLLWFNEESQTFARAAKERAGSHGYLEALRSLEEDERHLEKCRLELYNYQESSSSEELDAKYLNEMVALYEDITTGDEYENFHLARELDENLGLPLLPRLCVKIALICYHDNRPEDSERVDLAVRELRKLQALLANSGIDPQWINKINAWAKLGESIAKEIKRKRS